MDDVESEIKLAVIYATQFQQRMGQARKVH